MGLFTALKDTAISTKVVAEAKEVNRYQQSILSLLKELPEDSSITTYQLQRLNNYISSMAHHLKKFEEILKQITPDNQVQTIVPCIDGHYTGAFGYLMAAQMFLEMAQNLTKH